MVTPEIGEPECLLFALNWFRLSCKSCMVIQLSKLQLQSQVGKPSNKDSGKFYCTDGDYDTSDRVLMSVEGYVPVIDANNTLNMGLQKSAQACRSVHASLFYFNF